jgi:hypothetical protein
MTGVSRWEKREEEEEMITHTVSELLSASWTAMASDLGKFSCAA